MGVAEWVRVDVGGTACIPSQVDPVHWADAFRLGTSATVAVDSGTGGVVTFETAGGVSWATPTHPLLRFMYRTHSYVEKCKYAKTYQYSHGGIHPYSPGAYTPPSPGLNASATLVAHEWHAPVDGMWVLEQRPGVGTHPGTKDTGLSVYRSVLLRLNGSFAQDVSAGVPYSTFGAVWVNLTVADTAPTAHASLTAEVVWVAKTPTRLPESVWVEFRPRLPAPPPAAQGTNIHATATPSPWCVWRVVGGHDALRV